ncbi:MAG TPA: cytochrome b N-terminal domain-containing protein [Ardenticatenaceae bacterium]
MLGLGDLRDLPREAQRKLDELLNLDWEEKARDKVDETTRAVSGGLSVEELRAVFRGDPPTEKPNPRYKLHTKSFLMHLRPRYYQRASTWFTHTFRLGWWSTFFFFVETITGLILMVWYAPTPAEAYYDMLNIFSNVPFGKFMRDLHRLGAELMVISVTLHMMRVYFTGSYKHPRQFTWLTGVVLFLLTLLLSFSGYLLPWDQLAYWAVTIGASMADKAPLIGREVQLLLAGAPAIGANGLLRFYLLHVLFVPLLAILVISIHYYKVSREHSISLPAAVEEGEMDEERRRWAKERIDIIPDLMLHEIFLVVATLAAMILYVMATNIAPLEISSCAAWPTAAARVRPARPPTCCSRCPATSSSSRTRCRTASPPSCWTRSATSPAASPASSCSVRRPPVSSPAASPVASRPRTAPPAPPAAERRAGRARATTTSTRRRPTPTTAARRRRRTGLPARPPVAPRSRRPRTARQRPPAARPRRPAGSHRPPPPAASTTRPGVPAGWADR